MTESTQPPNSDPSQTDPATGQTVAAPFATVEEADAYYRTRQGGIQRAHNAQVAALEEQIELLRKTTTSAPAPTDDPAENLRRENEVLKQQLANQQRASALMTKFPDAAAILGEDVVKLSEDRIAAVNAVFQQQGAAPTNGGPPIIDPNSPPRTPTGGTPAGKRPEDMEPDELKQQLRALEPAYREMISNR